MQHNRTYSYDSQNNYESYVAQQQRQPQQGGSLQGYIGYDQHSSRQQYLPPSNDQTNSRYRTSSPLAPHRHSQSGGGNMSFVQPTSSSTPGNNMLPPSTYYSNTQTSQPYQTSRRHPTPSAKAGEFVPTPSEIYSNYNQTNQGMSSNATYVSSRSMMAASTTRSGDGVAPERFPCTLCGKDFSRSHDRKRHYSTSHDTNGEKPICEYCKKTFSRGDSLKRHRDNGCDSFDGRRN